MKKTVKKNISLDRIAKECGVCSMTVSRALRQLASVSETTRSRVLAAAEKLGYLPALSAGRKASKIEEIEAKPVQIIVRAFNGRIVRFHAELMLEIVRLLAIKRYECLVRVADDSYKEFLRILSQAGKTDAAATLLLGAFQPRELQTLLKTIPGAILLDDPGDSVPDCFYNVFAFDNIQASAMAVKHLLKKKRNRILLLTGPRDHFFTREVEEGYRKAMTAAGKKVDPSLILYTGFSVQDAVKMVEQAIDSGLSFDAVFTNDEMAGGVYRALLSRGKRIPQDIAVCGCDGLPVGEQLYPQLTTVILDYHRLAAKVIEMITDPEKTFPQHSRLLPVLQLREST